MLFGGSRSGKTFVVCGWLTLRALAAPASSHAILRSRRVHLFSSVVAQTMPLVLAARFPWLVQSWREDFNKSDGVWTLPNESQLWYGGLDDAERVEKILGQEHSTIHLNECSQIAYAARNKAQTRLAQDSGLDLKMSYDENPPAEGHWTERLFIRKIDPQARTPLPHASSIGSLLMNPDDNAANLPVGYFDFLDRLPHADRERFRFGRFGRQVAGALWTFDLLDRCRISPHDLTELGRVVIGVDPSGAKGPDDFRSDEIGIVAVGQTRFHGERAGIVLEDATMRGSPEQWARAALECADRWSADAIVAEINFGGDMVRAVIQGQRRSANVKLVHASKGKWRRAEPVAALYEHNQAVGQYPRVLHSLEANLTDLEDQLCNFAASGYKGATSPDRADAAIWALTELLVEESGYDLNVLGGD